MIPTVQTHRSDSKITKNHRKGTTSQTIELLKHATVVYTDGNTEIFDVVQVTERGAVIGRIYKENDREEFVNFGFIPQSSIKQIICTTPGRKSKKKL